MDQYQNRPPGALLPSVWKVARPALGMKVSSAKSRIVAAKSSSIFQARGLERCFTVKQVAGMLGYSEKQLRRLCHQKKIRTVQMAQNAPHRIPLSAVRELFQKTQSFWQLRDEREFESELLAALEGRAGENTKSE